MEKQGEMDITIVSDKGQIVIPAALRDRLELKPRSKMLVYGFDDAIVLKKLDLPDPKEEMERLLKKIDKKIERHGELPNEDIQKEIQRVRARKRKSKVKQS